MRCWKPASRSSPRTNAPPLTAAPAWTPPRCRCSPAARPGAPACAPATPTAAGTSARATTASARTTRASRCARLAWALEATIATTARPPDAAPACPNLAIGLALTRPGEDPGGTGARVLASAAARGHKTGWLGYDRAYTQALPGRFHLPARALGYQPVMDYRADQLGIQASTGGALLVEGTWYCPALPGPLITATTRLRDHAITRDLYDQQIAARACYQLKRKDGPDADGYQRLSCPAAGRHPGLICPLRQASLSPRDGRPKVLQPPQEPPRLCRQTAITIAPDIGARYRQDLPYGSPAWHAVLRHLAQHHRRPQRLRQRHRPPGPRPARPPPRPRHRRPLPLHRAAADGRQHPQDPRLAGPHRQRPGRHHPPGTATPHQPARLPPRRLTARSTHRHRPPSRAAATPQAPRTPQSGCQSPATAPARRPEPMSDPTGITRNGHRHSSVGTTPAVLSVTPGAAEGIRTPNLLIRSKIPAVQISPWLSHRPARRGRGRLRGPAASGVVHIRC